MLHTHIFSVLVQLRLARLALATEGISTGFSCIRMLLKSSLRLTWPSFLRIAKASSLAFAFLRLGGPKLRMWDAVTWSDFISRKWSINQSFYCMAFLSSLLMIPAPVILLASEKCHRANSIAEFIVAGVISSSVSHQGWLILIQLGLLSSHGCFFDS